MSPLRPALLLGLLVTGPAHAAETFRVDGLPRGETLSIRQALLERGQ